MYEAFYGLKQRTFSIVPQEPGTLRVDWALEKLRFSFPVTFDVP